MTAPELTCPNEDGSSHPGFFISRYTQSSASHQQLLPVPDYDVGRLHTKNISMGTTMPAEDVTKTSLSDEEDVHRTAPSLTESMRFIARMKDRDDMSSDWQDSVVFNIVGERAQNVMIRFHPDIERQVPLPRAILTALVQDGVVTLELESKRIIIERIFDPIELSLYGSRFAVVAPEEIEETSRAEQSKYIRDSS